MHFNKLMFKSVLVIILDFMLIKLKIIYFFYQSFFRLKDDTLLKLLATPFQSRALLIFFQYMQVLFN